MFGAGAFSTIVFALNPLRSTCDGLPKTAEFPQLNISPETSLGSNLFA